MLIKNHRQERQLLAKRLLILGISMAILMGGLIIQLSNLQLYHHARYTTLAIQNWLELVPIEPARGLIYDRYGHLLAENIPVFSLDIIPNQTTNLPQTLRALAQFITLSDDQI